MSTWKFKGREVLDADLLGKAGFVYIITNKDTGERYIGRKYLKSIRKVKGKTRRQSKESDWKTYWSSSDLLKEQVKTLGEDVFEREILCFGKTKGDVNYLEIFYQFMFNVLESDMWLNENIAGKWHKKPSHIKNDRVLDEELLARLSST